MHIDLTNALSVDCTKIASHGRTFTVFGGDSSTLIYFFKADTTQATSGPPLLDGRHVAQQNALVLRANGTSTFDNADSYIGYTFTGTAPGSVAVDGDTINAHGSNHDNTEL